MMINLTAATRVIPLTALQQEQKRIVAGDMLFPEGGYQPSANGRQALSQYVHPVLNRKADRVGALTTGARRERSQSTFRQRRAQ